MIGHSQTGVVEAYLAQLQRDGASASFKAFVAERAALSDDDLADLIESDGRARLARGEEVALEQYLEATPRIRACPVALDAAIDMALRSLSRSSEATPDAVETLVGRHPELAKEIRTAAAIGQLMLSTNAMRRVLPFRAVMSLPTDFGPRIGTGVRRFQLREHLGRGSFADVYLGVDRQLSDERSEALVAVKILNARGDEWSMRQASLEAIKARRIDHPNVVRALDRGVSDEGDHYVVYEYVPGGALDVWVKERGRLSPREAARLVRDMALGVQAAHAASLVHADIKPGNILMAAGDAPKVADFGVAVESEGEPRGAAQREQRLVGSLAFMSPEQYRRDEGWRTPATDVYALGGMLFWMLSNQHPNGSEPVEIRARLGAQEGQPAPSVCAVRPDVDADLDTVCQKAMAWRREDRHDSAGALAADLQAWLAHEPIWWRKPSLPKIVRLWARRRPFAATASAVGGIAAIAALVLGGWITQSMLSARSKVEEQVSRSASVIGALNAFTASIRRRAEGRHAESSLLALHSIETVEGQQLKIENIRNMEYGDVWVPLAQRILQSYEQHGTDRTLEAGLWRTALAFRLTALDRYDEASETISRARAVMKPLLAVDDEPLLRLLDDLDRCVMIGRAVAARAERELTHGERLSLADAETSLWRRLQSADPEAPLNRQEALFAWFVEEANAPELLGDAARVEFAQRFRRNAWREEIEEAAAERDAKAATNEESGSAH